MKNLIPNLNKDKSHGILTFDYELFLGKKSGSLEKCLINPVNRIIDIFQKWDEKGIFFIDTCYLFELKKNDKNSYETILKQIKKLVEINCDVGIHIHPHWEKVFYDSNGNWRNDNLESFRLDQFPSIKIKELFSISQNLLQDISKKEVKAFRAGGWSLPHFSMIAPFFEENKLRYDFSVLPGKLKTSNNLHSYNYRSCPQNKSYWPFSDNVNQESFLGKFIEIPTTMVRSKRFSVITNRIKNSQEKIYGDGLGIAEKSSFIEKISKLIKNETQYLSFDYQHFDFFKENMEIVDKIFVSKSLPFWTLAAHPKLSNESWFNSLNYICQHYKTLNIQDLNTFLLR